MTLWRTTVLPAVQQICTAYNFTGVMVVEDTVLLRKDVTYVDIAAEIMESKARAGVWGYGNKWEIKKNEKTFSEIGWSGTKGLWMTPAWCEEINLMLENTNFDRYRHVDMWLVDLLKRRRSQGFCLLSLLAGYGHRVSMSTSEPGQQKFGGCFLPEVPQLRFMRQEDMENYIYENAPPGIKEWFRHARLSLEGSPSVWTWSRRNCLCQNPTLTFTQPSVSTDQNSCRLNLESMHHASTWT